MLDGRGAFSGSAFIKYYDEDAAKRAARTLNGLRVGSRLIRADLSRRQHAYTDAVKAALEKPFRLKPEEEREPGPKHGPPPEVPPQPSRTPLDALYPHLRLRLLRLKSM
ncbi:hypothetical protein GMRT_fx023 [Giardia muris]|uniref:RRM domain-containing protein n=1 Tax=Giardia muris TaxID=5742 RepID=A0A4Z1T3C8_GIAMU|nr:hypothetical protein GMRT_fx023 [Giardia muris]|eukprot:TNJ27059.1 hypothetical protein GMRT_fx023 [Giardia muris]